MTRTINEAAITALGTTGYPANCVAEAIKTLEMFGIIEREANTEGRFPPEDRPTYRAGPWKHFAIQPDGTLLELSDAHVKASIRGNCGQIHQSVEEWRACRACDAKLSTILDPRFPPFGTQG